MRRAGHLRLFSQKIYPRRCVISSSIGSQPTAISGRPMTQEWACEGLYN